MLIQRTATRWTQRSCSGLKRSLSVDTSRAPPSYDNSAVVYTDFITTAQEEMISAEIATLMKRKRYQKGHWDAVIENYKETELIQEEEMLSTDMQEVLTNIRTHLSKNHSTASPDWLPCHAIQLHPDGELNAHVDSVKFSGDIIAGLSLLSPAIMRLIPEKAENNATEFVDLYLPPRSLYVLCNQSRYDYSHQLLPSGAIYNNSIKVDRGLRLSLIFRDAKAE